MQYVNLETITEEHLQGKWEVYNRRIGTSAAENVFHDVRIIEMDANCYRSINGCERTGKWMVERDRQIIYNPQVRFYINEQEVAHAIITRLSNETTNNFKLTLYFNTGLELVLHKTTFNTPDND